MDKNAEEAWWKTGLVSGVLRNGATTDRWITLKHNSYSIFAVLQFVFGSSDDVSEVEFIT